MATQRKLEHLKKKVGAKSIYTPELAKRVADKIASEYKSLTLLHKENPEWFPVRDTILGWRVEHPEFVDTYLNAKRMQAQLGAEALKNVSEKAFSFTYTDKDGNLRIDAGAVAACNLESNNIKWSTGRLAQQLYGDRVEQNVTVLSFDDAIKSMHGKIKE